MKKLIITSIIQVLLTLVLYLIISGVINRIVAASVTQIDVRTNGVKEENLEISVYGYKEVIPESSFILEYKKAEDGKHSIDLSEVSNFDRFSLRFMNYNEKETELFEIKLSNQFFSFILDQSEIGECLLPESKSRFVDGDFVKNGKGEAEVILSFKSLQTIIREQLWLYMLFLLSLCFITIRLLKKTTFYSSIFNPKSKGIVLNLSFVVVVLLPMVFFISHYDEALTLENAILKKRTFKGKLLAYFPFKNNLLELNNHVEETFLGDLLNKNEVVIGRDNFLFKYREGTDLSKYKLRRKFLDEKQIDFIVKRIKSHNDYCRENKIEYLRFYYPTKFDVYPDKLPEPLQNAIQDTITRMEQVTDALSSVGIELIGCKDVLIENKSRGLFRKNDTHWNYMGSFFAYNKLMKVLYDRTKYDGYIPYDFDDFGVWNDKVSGGDLVVKLANHHAYMTDSTQNLTLKYKSEWKFSDPSGLPHNSRIIVNQYAKTNQTLLLFSDSFPITQRKFFVLNFRKVIHLRDQPFNTDLIKRLKPDVIFEGYTEGTMNNIKL